MFKCMRCSNQLPGEAYLFIPGAYVNRSEDLSFCDHCIVGFVHKGEARCLEIKAANPHCIGWAAGIELQNGILMWLDECSTSAN
jgi:hypothetical protein